MKKIININFHGRVVPIEESAFDILTQYIESLRKYFANEEGRDEIINDIENRFAELFSERLKKDSTCITDMDVNSIIASMGRPEDFDDVVGEGGSSTSAKTDQTGTGGEGQQSYQGQYSYQSTRARGRFFRNADDKILGGVCSGLANYLSIDPVILRILFVVLLAPLFWVYILLWIIVPSQSQQSKITKRLYRSSDDKVIGGVAGGLAAYFNIQVWIPRLIFALPFVLGILSGIFHAALWDWDLGIGPRIISGGLGSTLVISYIILWIAVPVATTATEKLEMRGARVDLNSIASTIKEDMEGFKGRAQKMGSEFREGAQRMGSEIRDSFKDRGKNFGAEFNEKSRTHYNGFAQVIGIMAKAFFLFISSVIALAMFGVLIGLIFAGTAVFPLKSYFLSGYSENLLAWCSLILFLGIPLLAIITWLVRRIMGVHSRRHYLGYVFSSLWIIGLICTVVLLSIFARSLRDRDFVEESVSINQPTNGKLYVDQVSGIIGHHYSIHRWSHGYFEWDSQFPLFTENYDSMYMNNVRVDIVKSKDSAFHVQKIKISRGSSVSIAQNLANHIAFNVSQQENTLLLPQGFAISEREKFRNQQVLVIIEVPLGKKIELDEHLDRYDWWNIHMDDNHIWHEWGDDWNSDWGENYSWESGKEYMMTREGLEETEVQDDNQKEARPEHRIPHGGYRYKGGDSDQKKESVSPKDSAAPAKPMKEKSAKQKDTDQEDGETTWEPVNYLWKMILAS
jgi:phage shock protein PspC (stress-responsive transcriptional regulator)